MDLQLHIPPLLRRQLWALMVLIDFNYSRLIIADYLQNNEHIILWLEDRDDMINSLATCLKLEVPLENLYRIVSPDRFIQESLNGYYSIPVNIAGESALEEGINWFTNIACLSQKQLAVDTLLSALLTQTVDTEFYELC